MGGGLIIEILEKSPEAVSCLQSLILQPQLDIPEVRRYIHKIGFAISKESMITDAGKFYNVIVCEPGEELGYSEAEYLLGRNPLERKSDVFIEYLVKRLEELRKIESNIQKSSGNLDTDGRKRLMEVRRLIEIFEGCYYERR